LIQFNKRFRPAAVAENVNKQRHLRSPWEASSQLQKNVIVVVGLVDHENFIWLTRGKRARHIQAWRYNSKNECAGWRELPQRQLSLFKSLMACRHTRAPEMLSALTTKIMFWALAGVIFSAAKIVSCNNKLNFHGLPSK
jgi:hypothetical protein